MSTVVDPLEEKRAPANWLARLCARADDYENSDPAPFGPLAVAFCLYAFILLLLGNRPLWHDELYTYYIAKAPTLKQFIEQVTHLDLQPPLGYVLSRVSLRVLGDSPFATRMPSMLAFTVASVCVYFFVRRRLGRFFGLLAILVLWLTPFLYYAGEARPYALVIGFFALTMLGWQEATEGRRRRLGLLAVLVGVWGMIVSHVFSPLLVIILAVAELTRSLDQRKIDWPVWTALLAPSPFVVVYIPLLRGFEAWTVVPPQFRASLLRVVFFYAEILSAVGAVLLIALTAALFGYRSRPPKAATEHFSARRHEIALVFGLLALPVVINLALMRSRGAFWPRYSIPTGIAVALIFVYVLAKLTNGNRPAAAIASLCVFVGIIAGIAQQVVQPPRKAMVPEISIAELDPSLPVVDASGLTFLEMNKRESKDVLARVYYLTDRDAAIRYAQATIFEGAANLHRYWPIRGTVKPYEEFVRGTPHFFVLGTPDYPEDWLIPKLLADGAELDFKGQLRASSYKDSMIFEVRMPAPKNVPASTQSPSIPLAK